MLNAESLFIYPPEGDAAAAYTSWLREVLGNALTLDEDGFDTVTRLAVEFGPSIRRRLEVDPEFRAGFHIRYWPRLVEVVRSDPTRSFELYLSQEHLWDMLKREDGVALLKRWQILAVSVMYGDPMRGIYPCSEDVRESVAQVLLEGDNKTVEALQRFRNEPQFHALLKRHLPARTVAAAADKLLATREAYPTLLNRYQSLGDAALAEEVGPTPDGPSPGCRSMPPTPQLTN